MPDNDFPNSQEPGVQPLPSSTNVPQKSPNSNSDSDPDTFTALITYDLPSVRETYELTKHKLGWKIHLYLMIAICFASFGAWFGLSWVWPHFPWFFWVWGTAAMSLTLHYFIFLKTPRRFLQWHVSWYMIIVACQMLTWLCTGGRFMWWLIVALSWAHFLNIHYNLVRMYKKIQAASIPPPSSATTTSTSPSSANTTTTTVLPPLPSSPSASVKSAARWEAFLRIHRTSFIILQAKLFFLWVQTSRSYPWFLVTFFALGLLYVIHHSLYYHPRDYFRLHSYVYVDVQLMLFVIWAATVPSVPWFVLPAGGWGVLLLVHFILLQRFGKNKREPLLPFTKGGNDNKNTLSYDSTSSPSSALATAPPQEMQTASEGTYATMYPQLHSNNNELTSINLHNQL